jgi:hypothetical protein
MDGHEAADGKGVAMLPAAGSGRSDPEQAAFPAGLVTAVYAGVLWRRGPRPLQQLAVLAGLATAASAGVAALGGRAAGRAGWPSGRWSGCRDGGLARRRRLHQADNGAPPR